MAVVIRPTISGRSQIVPDARTSKLIVMATEKELLDVDLLIEKLDTATKQVLIEAKIIETVKSPNSVKGIDWGGTLPPKTSPSATDLVVRFWLTPPMASIPRPPF